MLRSIGKQSGESVVSPVSASVELLRFRDRQCQDRCPVDIQRAWRRCLSVAAPARPSDSWSTPTTRLDVALRTRREPAAIRRDSPIKPARQEDTTSWLI